MKKRFDVRFEGTATIELDEAVIKAVDDGWRKMFYPLYTPEEIAQHIAYNLVINQVNLSQLDGWADQPDSNARVISNPDWWEECE